MSCIFLFVLSQISIDIGQFRADKEFALCELYISIPYSELHYKKVGDMLESRFRLRVAVKSPVSDSIVQEFSKVSRINSYVEAEARKLRMLEQVDLFLQPNDYDVRVEAISDSTIKSAEQKIHIESYSSLLCGSDIELATAVDSADSGKFIKNGIRVIPNPQAIFGDKYPTLYTYTEIYNLTPSKEYEVSYFIFNESGDSLYRLAPKILTASSKNLTEVGTTNVNAFKEGSYILKIKITQGEQSFEKEKKFWVVRKIDEKMEFTSEELQYYHLINYIARPEELKFYNNLSPEVKHQYLINFWTKVGKSSLHTLIDRIKYVDQNFSLSGTSGRESDRGRIWIKYGKPDETEKFPFTSTYRACEKWSYFSQGKTIFVFLDKLDNGRYELMYSSILEERTTPDYMRWINPEALQ